MSEDEDREALVANENRGPGFFKNYPNFKFQIKNCNSFVASKILQNTSLCQKKEASFNNMTVVPSFNN